MSITFGHPEVFARHDVGLTQNKLTAWPDGLFGTRWFRPTGQPVFWASNGGNLALVDAFSGGSVRFPRPNGLPEDIGYCSGGPILTSPVDGSWVMVNHAERYTINKVMWSTIELTRSTDDGHSWEYVGCIIEPCKRFDNSNTIPCEIAGGSVVYAGEDLHFYFREPQEDYRGRAGMAYINALEFFTAIADGAVPQLKKWTLTGLHPDAVGGSLADQLLGLPMECNWQSVVYVANKRLFLMTFCPFGDTGAYKGKGIYGATSPDGIDWTSLGTDSLVKEPGYCYYPNLIAMDYDERFALSYRLHLYYMLVQNPQTVWPGMEVRRMRVNF